MTGIEVCVYVCVCLRIISYMTETPLFLSPLSLHGHLFTSFSSVIVLLFDTPAGLCGEFMSHSLW